MKQTMELFSGTWWSTKYTAAFSRGNVWVSLHPEEHKESYQADAKIKYLGMYRLRQEEQIPITITPTSTVAEAKEFVTPPSSVKGNITPSGTGVLTFTIVKRAGNKIEGTYMLSNPLDTGKFKLEKGPNHVEQCAVM